VLARQQLDGLTTRLVHLGAHRQQVAGRALHDRGELLPLRVRRVDLDVQMLEHTVEVLVDSRGIQRRAHEAGAMPSPRTAGVGDGLDPDHGRERCEGGGDRRAPEETSARLRVAGSGRLRGGCRVSHGCSFPGLEECHVSQPSLDGPSKGRFSGG